jgi:5-methylcytosine-specific restriction enzyme A
MPEQARRYTGRKGKTPPPSEGERETANGRGYGYRWQRARAVYLKANPLCVECGKAGHVEEATTVDHIRPHRGNYSLFWDHTNWQALCTSCHNRKTGKGK